MSDDRHLREHALSREELLRGHFLHVVRETVRLPDGASATREFVLHPGAVKNDWIHPRIFGNYANDYQMRSVVNLVGIWANNAKEAVYFGVIGLDGSRTYIQTYPKSELPSSKAQYFWSVIAVDGEKYQVIPNSLNRYLLNKQSALQFNPDGSLTLAFAPKLPAGISQSNWLPTPEGKRYNMTYRFYGPSKDVAGGKYYPPALVVRQ